MKKINKNDGVALREMVAMIGMIAMLAAVAIPSHIDFERKKQISEAHIKMLDVMSKFSLCIHNSGANCDRLLVNDEIDVVVSEQNSLQIKKTIDLYRNGGAVVLQYSGKLEGEKLKWKSESEICELKAYENSKRICSDYEL